MATAGHVNDLDHDFAIRGLSLFECCCCHSSKHDPIQLNCLHYYCRSCFHLSDSKKHVLRSTVTCPVCSEATEISPVLTNNFLSTYRHVSALRAEIVWCNTCQRTAMEESAEFWCVVCAEALCAACYVRHNKFTSGHRIFELEYARCLPISQLTSTVQCNLHKRPIEAHCFTCCLPKCRACLEFWSAGSHDLHLLSDEVTQDHVSSVTNRMRDAQNLLVSLLPRMLQKCRAIVRRVQICRTSGHGMLLNHRRRLHDSAYRAFDESMDILSCGRRNTRHEHIDVLVKVIPRSCAAAVNALAVSGVRSLQLLNARNLLKSPAVCCSSSIRTATLRRLHSCVESDSIIINGSVPLTSDIALNASLGATDCRRSAPPAPLLFRETCTSFETPVACWDLAVTRDGHVLLAALMHGLLIYNDRGEQLCSWRPARRSNGEDDGVSSVAMLSDGRAAVSVVHAQLVVLLRRSHTGDTWLEDRHVAVLQSPPRRLAVYGDLVAATQCRPHAEQQPQMWSPASEVTLLSLSSGKLLYIHRRDYDVQNVALTALCVITTSLDTLTRGSGLSAYVVDAFSHAGQLMWRYETSSEELVWGLCVSADAWSRVYVSVWRRDRSSRVIAIRAVDGRDNREMMSSMTHGLQLPAELSLARGQQRTVLAVLNWVEKLEELRSISLYEACN